MNILIKKSLLTLAVAGVFISPFANATNGFFTHGTSTKEKGLAGAGAAYSQDALAAATNPAGMAFIGERFDIGVAIFSPSPRSYTVTGTPLPPSPPLMPLGSGINAVPGEKVESDTDFFLIPHIGYNWQLDKTTAVGVSMYGNGGMNTDYAASSTPPSPLDPTGPGLGTFGDGTTGINLEQAFFNVSIANKLDDKHAIGVSVILVIQRFSAEGLSGFGAAGFSVDPTNLTSGKNSTSTGLGLKFGYQGEVADGVRIGLSYQPKINMSEFDDYAGLFANGGKLDIPATYTLGVSFDVGSSGTVVADIQEIKYSGSSSISNPLSNLFAFCNPGDASGCLGGTNGVGFGWQDMTVYKIGYQLESGDNTYRVGYSHASQPVPESDVFFNILAPAVVEDHITVGWTKRLANNQEFNLSGLYVPSNSVKGANPLDGGSTQIEIEMSQWEIQAGWAWTY